MEIKMTTRRVIVVEWIDICTLSAWQSAGEVFYQPAKCVSVGVEMLSSREGIVIAQSLTANGDAADCTSIPRKVIQRVKVVGRVKC